MTVKFIPFPQDTYVEGENSSRTTHMIICVLDTSVYTGVS